MAIHSLRREDRLPLLLALAAHAVLFAWLAWQRPAPPVPLPERMTVTLSDELGPVSTAPEPQADPAPAAAPVLGEVAPPPEPAATPQPRPAPLAKQPVPKPAPKSTPKAPPRKGGAPDFDAAFSPGSPGGAGKEQSKSPPAAAPSSQLVSSWSSSIGAKVRGPWNSCAVSGLDAEKLVVTVRFTLDRFGEISSLEEPTVAGVTDGNRPQVARFKECAVRAIRTAAPFDSLPREYYDFWKARRLNFRKQ